jgi:hypothetical protein
MSKRTKRKAVKPNKEPIIIPEVSAMVLYRSVGGERGWWVREYHSEFAMKAHLKHLKTGAPPPKHWHTPKNWDWEASFGETGPFTKREAVEYATEPLQGGGVTG